jgi:myosin heavy subunit
MLCGAGEYNSTGNLIMSKVMTPPTARRNMPRPAEAAANQSNTAHKRSASVGRQFTQSLMLLVEKMNLCRPHFVR